MVKNAGRKALRAGNGREAGITRNSHEMRISRPFIPPPIK